MTSKDIIAAVREGYDSIELAKRYTTATMGPTQGKLEVVNAVAIVAEVTGKTIAETGTTTWRPPLCPGHARRPGWPRARAGALLAHAVLARGSPYASSARREAWVRPDHYGDPFEARNVRERVGVIDITRIGKLDLRGPDVPALLNLLYVNKWSKLGIGRVRYGVMCTEDGVVFDDGVTGRLEPQVPDEHDVVRGGGRVGVGGELAADRASGLGRAHHAGDHRLREHERGRAGLAGTARPADGGHRPGETRRSATWRVRHRPGRGVTTPVAVLWRIGFTGELSYELHVPAGYGLAVWEALMDRGQDLGVAPFGVEAQRILRLEEGHLIVGQDTDGLTRGFSAGLDWAIKLDEENSPESPNWPGRTQGP